MLVRFSAVIGLALAVTVSIVAPAQAEVQKTIPNDLKLSWPADLAYFDLTPAEAKGINAIEILGQTVPVQIESVTVDGKPVARAWFVAEIQGEKNDKGKRQSPPASIPVTYKTAATDQAIAVTEHKTHYLIDNGVYEFRLTRYAGKLPVPTQLGDLPHFVGGMRLKGTDHWDGRAWFEGTFPVVAAHTEIVQQGPVFVDFKITIEFADADTGEQTVAMPLANGKQTYKFAPNTLPTETIAKKTKHYEAVIRFVLSDPWIDVNERFHFPKDPDVGGFGIAQYWIAWGEPVDAPALPGFAKDEHAPIDTAMWTRWFEYDVFGGNTSLGIREASPRPAQKGRPFALLRPRWNQGGGGAQEFFLTSGGKSPWWDRKKKETITPEGYDPGNPAFGVVAAFASKWVGPYAHTIAAYAYDGNRGRVRFPLIDGSRAKRHYAQRAYGLVCGPRWQFDNTGKMNSLVRRHSDWTLVAQINKYNLDWDRDPSKAGPTILATREKVEKLQKAWKAGKDTNANGIIRASIEQREKLQSERDALRDQIKAADEARKNKELDEQARKQASDEYGELRGELKKVENRLGSDDMLVLGLLTDDIQKKPSLSGWEGAGLWLERRYQDDFLNPTSRTTRNQKNWGPIDLFSDGKPIGGAWNAALAYIHTDLDQWPGWHNGWSPGNPNFHTDKYMVALYIGAAMLDHPHADEWVRFGELNFREDMQKVFLAPDGVGYECPGYSGYSMTLQAGLAKIIYNTGLGNPFGTSDLVKKSAIWHRKLITPYDTRLHLRHEAPIGDSHRWNAGLNLGFAKIAPFFTETDPDFARELVGTYQFLVDNNGVKKDADSLMFSLIQTDPSIEPMDVKDMDWSSGAFYGFGAIFRNNFGTDRESHLTFKAGPTRGHYHNDENSYHFYSGGTPISLDYNCSYSPRGDHSALHNAMTFGTGGVVIHNKRNEPVEAMEQLYDTAYVGAMATSDVADAVIAERSGNRLTLYPVEPRDHEFGRGYPNRKVDEIIHRRLLVMVKHPVGSKLQDYIVVRDETRTSEPQQVNIHLLARDAKVDGNTIHLTGQLDKDILVQVITPESVKVDVREWFYWDDWMKHPGEYAMKPDETLAQWDARMKALMKENGVNELPLPGWKPEYGHPSGNNDWFKQIQATKGRTLMMPHGWTAPWRYGECQIWLRLHAPQSADTTWVLYPYPRGGEQPTITPLADGKGVRVTLGDTTEEIYLATDPADGVDGQVVIKRNGETTTLIPAKTVGPLGSIERKPIEEIDLTEE